MSQRLSGATRAVGRAILWAAPWMMKIIMMLFGSAPRVRRMAISAPLSATTSRAASIGSPTGRPSTRWLSLQRTSPPSTSVSCGPANAVFVPAPAQTHGPFGTAGGGGMTVELPLESLVATALTALLCLVLIAVCGSILRRAGFSRNAVVAVAVMVLALAGVGACTRQPDEQIIPYVRQPENIVPGRRIERADQYLRGVRVFGADVTRLDDAEELLRDVA